MKVQIHTRKNTTRSKFKQYSISPYANIVNAAFAVKLIGCSDYLDLCLTNAGQNRRNYQESKHELINRSNHAN